MNDYVIRGMAAGNEIRFVAAYTRETVEKAREIHNTSPVCSAALGRLLTGGALMGAMCKNDTDVLTLKVTGNGPIHSITVTADAFSNVKGIIYNNAVDLPLKSNGHLDVGTAVGAGTLTVIRDEGVAEPYVGQTALVSGEIGEDLTYYFAESEQIPTSVGVGVLVDREIKRKGMCQLTQGKDVFGGDIVIEEPLPVKYHCNCSRERVTKALVSLGRKELQSIIDDGEPITMHCDFCNSDYTFEIPEVQALMSNI